MEIKKVGVWSFVKVIVILGIIFGLIWGIFISLYASFVLKGILAQASNPQVQEYLQQSGIAIEDLTASWQTINSYGWIIVTIVSTVISFIVGLIVALVYNLTAKYLGGIKIDLEGKK